MEIVQTETYESETEYLEISFQNDGNFIFTKKTKDGNKCFSCGADFVSDNVAVYDGKHSLPEQSMYYEFIFECDTITLLNHGEMVDVYLKVSNNVSEYSLLPQN